MPLIQGGPPEWIWERTANLLRWDVVPAQAPDGHPLCELRVQCGLEILRLQFLTADEVRELRDVLDSWASQPLVSSERGPGAPSASPGAESRSRREGQVVSDPDFAPQH